MNNEDKKDTILVLQRSLMKLIEIKSLIRDGKVVVAHEKLDGVIKIIDACGAKLQQDNDNE